MSDKPELEIARQVESMLTLAPAQSAMVARGRRDAAALMRPEEADYNPTRELEAAWSRFQEGKRALGKEWDEAIADLNSDPSTKIEWGIVERPDFAMRVLWSDISAPLMLYFARNPKKLREALDLAPDPRSENPDCAALDQFVSEIEEQQRKLRRFFAAIQRLEELLQDPANERAAAVAGNYGFCWDGLKMPVEVGMAFVEAMEAARRKQKIARGLKESALPSGAVRDALAEVRRDFRMTDAEREQQKDQQAQTRLAEERTLAAQGDPEAQRSLGTHYWNKDDGESAQWFRRAAEQGDAYCQYHIGDMYRRGKGVPQEKAEALKWLRQAAERGYDEARWALIDICYNGEGVPRDYVEAAKWARADAEDGSIASQYLLGMMYAEGKGVPQDLARAHMWIDLAASGANAEESHGVFDAAKYSGARDALEAKMSPDQIEEARRLVGERRKTRGQRQ